MISTLPSKARPGKGLITLLAIITALLSFSNLKAQPTNYCNPNNYGPTGIYHYCYWDDSWGREYYWSYITGVQFVNKVTGGVDYEHNSADDGCFVVYDNDQASVMLGTQYDLNVTYYHNYYCEYGWGYWIYNRVRVFIDWNQDGDFEDQQQGPMNEFVYGTPDDFNVYYEPSCEYKTVTIPIDIPCSVKPGKTRMRVMVSKYDPYPYDASYSNACTNGWYYLSDWGNYNYIYGEIEDYILNFTTNITASFPSDAPDDRSILYANEAYDGTQRLKNGSMTNFYKPQVTFSSPQPEGTYLSYKIVGPLPSTQVVYEALDPQTGSTDIQIGGFGTDTYEIQKARGTCSYPQGNSDGSFLSTSGGEYRVSMRVSGAGCPGEAYKLFTVAWTNDLSARDIVSPKPNIAPKFFKYLRGNTIRVTGQFQNVGLANVTKFNGRAVIFNAKGEMIYDRTVPYDTANPGMAVLPPKQKVELEFPAFRTQEVGIYRMYLCSDLLSAIDQESFNNCFPRDGEVPYTFEIQHEIQLQASQMLLPRQGQVLLGNRPVIPKGEFRNVGVGDASDIQARLNVYKLPNTTNPVFTSSIIVQDIPSGKYNVKSEQFDLMTLRESGDYKACLIITHPDDVIREDDTTCITFSVLGGLTGTYTVGTKNLGRANNFPTIDSAMNALYLRGVVSPVTFELTDDTYNVRSKSSGPAWDFTSYIINSGALSPNNINTITWKPSAAKALTRGGVTINLYSTLGKGVAFGQSIEPTNRNSIFNEFSSKISLARKYANSAGYITFDGGTQKSLRFVLHSGSSVNGSVFYLDKGSENITIKNVLVENGTPSLSNSSRLPMTVFSPIEGFIFQNDTLEAGDVDLGYSAGIVMRATLDKSEKAMAFRLDTVPSIHNTIEGNEISGFGFGILSLGIGELLIERTGNFQRFFNQNNTISGNIIHDIYRAGIFLGYEENSNITNNRIYSIGGGDIAAAGIMAGIAGSKDYKGYHNIGLNISGNEISGVSSGSYAAGIRVEQSLNTYPHATKTQVSYPDVPENMKITSNAVWGITTNDASASRAGIHLFTERGANLQTPANTSYLTRNDMIINNTVIMGGDNGLLNTGMVAGLAIQQSTGAMLFNNAVALLDNEADPSAIAFANVFYQGTMPKAGGLTSDYNAFWVPPTSSADVFRFIETDANNKIIDFGTNGDYKTLSQWQAWTGQDMYSIYGNFTGDLAYTGTDPNRRLGINGTPMGSILNNRGERISWLTSDIAGNLRGSAGQRYDIGAFEFAGGMRVSDMEISGITSPFVYRSSTGTFSDAEYIMTTSPVDIKAMIRNNGSIQASGVVATVKIYKETPAGTFSTSPVLTETVKVAAASTETIEAAFNLADGKLKEFAPQTYADLKADGYKVADHFKTMQANVTPRYRIDVEVESDQYNANNISSKVVRFYILHSNLGMVVSAENTYKDIATGTPTKDEIAGRLNYDTLMRGFNKIGWMANLDSNRTDIDIFDRLGWEPKAVNYNIYRTLVWSDGDDKALARFERSDIRSFLNSGTSSSKKNLLIGSQEIVRANEPTDPAFVHEVLGATNVAPSNPLGMNVSNDGNTLIGLNIGRGLAQQVLATKLEGDQPPYAGLVKVSNTGEGLALPAYYYKNHASKTDSIAGVAGATLLRNVTFVAIDWRHSGNIEQMLRQQIDFAEKNGGTVIPVELTAFTATARDKRVDVEWATASEFNSDRFEVERAERSNGVTSTFATIATEKAAGKSTAPLNYGPVIDRNVEMNHTYVYRLRMFDKDGSSKLSGEAVAVLSGSQVLWMDEVMPNPVENVATVNYSLPQSGQAELALYDMAGRRIMTLASGEISAGSHEYKLNVSSLANGVYTIMLTSGSDRVTRQVNVIK